MSDVDRATIEMMVLAAREAEKTCQFCGCHGDSCSLPEGGDERCTWINKSRTACSGCSRAYYKANRKYRRPKGRAA